MRSDEGAYTRISGFGGEPKVLVLDEPPKMLDAFSSSLISAAFFLEFISGFPMILRRASVTSEINQHRIGHRDSGVNIKKPGRVRA